MISTSGVTLNYGERTLFKDVNVKFINGNCYGLIGANGAGKSTFLKILSGEISPDHGEVSLQNGARLAILKQNQFEFDEKEVIETVLMGDPELYSIKLEKDLLYSKSDFNDEDGIRASELELKFADLNGWDAETKAAQMLCDLGITPEFHNLKVGELEAGQKVKVLLAQALSGDPDILLLDEPTNNLDIDTILWLEEFLCEFKNTVVVVSHDRHFLDRVTTHTADIDYGQISMFTGNYSFWYQSSQLALRQRNDHNKKNEDKIKELKTFIERFSANAAKSRQATARKKMIDKLSIEEIKPSTRRYPHIRFQQQREAGKDLLRIEQMSAKLEGDVLFSKFTLEVMKGEKIAFVGSDARPSELLFEILAGVDHSAIVGGQFKWGVTTNIGYFPKENDEFFRGEYNLIDWLRQYAGTKEEREEEYIRGFLGKMLFSGEEVKKKTNVLSGGERVRCMLSRLMFMQANVLILNEPTNHLDLESIAALNNGLVEFPGTVLFTSQDREMVDTIASRIIELGPKGFVDKHMPYSEFLEDPQVRAARLLIK